MATSKSNRGAAGEAGRLSGSGAIRSDSATDDPERAAAEAAAAEDAAAEDAAASDDELLDERGDEDDAVLDDAQPGADRTPEAFAASELALEDSVSEALELPVSRGHDTGSLGPSDLSDSGSDFAAGRAAGDEELISDSDSAGTGVRAGVGRHDGEAADTLFDRVVGAEDAGLGDGLDEAEEALRGPSE